MTRTDILVPVAVCALLFGLSVTAGPTIGVGAFLGLVLLGVIFLWPIIGLGLMFLAGTALQVLGSEHLIGLPLSLGKIFGLLTLLAWIARSLIDRAALTYSPQLAALIGFAICLTLLTLAADDPAVAREGLYRYAQLFLLFFMIASIAGQSRTTLDAACLSLTACMALSAVIGLLEFFIPALAIESDDPALIKGAVGAIIDRDSIEGVEIKRITGGLSDSNWFAYTLVAVLPLNLYLWHRYHTWAMRCFLLAAAALQSSGIVLSYTRSAMLALGVIVIVLLVKRRLPLAPVIVVTVIGAAAVVVWNPPGLERVFSTQYLRESSSTQLRAALLRGGIALVKERPLVGYGYNQFGPSFYTWLQHQPVEEAVAVWERHLEKRVAAAEETLEGVMPHNTILQVWVEYGLFGLLAFTLFLLLSLSDLRVARHFGSAAERELADCLLAGILGLLTCTIFTHIALLKIIWILPGLAAALRRVALTGDSATPLWPSTLAVGRIA